ncbi:zinc-binding dehydrogenase [Saliphagus sp. GCM10025334]
MASQRRMPAAVLNEPGDLSIEEVPVPEPESGEVLVRIRACGVCGTDLKMRDHGWPGAEYPVVLGHEWTGEVVELGPNTHKFAVGDRVADETHDACGFCKNCKVGRYTACLNYGDESMGHKHHGFTVDGGYTHYCTIGERNLHHLPDELSFREGTLITTAGCSQYAVEKADVQAGDFVVVIGPGAIGLTAVQCANFRGASEVVMTGTREERLEVAREVGADHTIDVTEVDPVERVASLTDGLGADVVIETAARHDTIAEAVEMTAPAGNVALLGNPGEGTSPIPTSKLVAADIDLHGVKAQGMNSAHRVTQLLAKRDFWTDPILTHEFEFEDFFEAIDTFENRRDGAIKVVVRF